jgi:hypothetical protein
MLNTIRNVLGMDNGGDEPKLEPEPEPEPKPEPEDDDGLVEREVLVRKTYTETVTREKVEIIWKDDPKPTARWCDSWEKDEGDYIFKSSEKQVVSNRTSWYRESLRHVYHIDLRVPEGNVKAVDVVDTEEWEAEASTLKQKTVTMPKDEVGDYDTHTTKRPQGSFVVETTFLILEWEQFEEYRNQYGKDSKE